MFLQIPDLLTAAEVADLRAIAAATPFVDGRVSNPHSKVKNNEIVTDAAAHAQAARIMLAALARSEPFKDFAMPRTVASPILTRYATSKHYGLHADAAFMPMKDRPLRADLSCTIFLSDPESYEGGALSVRLGDHTAEFKLAAGAAIVYPSTTLHEVIPVAHGERLVGLTFIESKIADAWKREILYELNEVVALEGLTMAHDNFTRAQRVQQALQRMWMEH
jgi:PKHD-type hydroxylase